MDITELQKTHAEHAKRVADWRKWRAVYDGIDAIFAGGYFRQHERETDDNFERHCEEALSWGVSRGIVDLFAQYLFLHEIERDYGRLASGALGFREPCLDRPQRSSRGSAPQRGSNMSAQRASLG
jgi:hypothetical protein